MGNKVVVVSCIEGYLESRNNDFEYASAMAARHSKVISKCSEPYDAIIIDDEISDNKIVAFNKVEDAIAFAVEIQHKFVKHPKLPVQVGIDKGEVVIDNNKISGTAYNIASKIAESAKAGSVIISYNVEEEIEDLDRFSSEFIDVYDYDEHDLEIRLFAIQEDELIVPEPEEINAHIKPETLQQRRRSSKISHILISIGTLIAASALFAYLNVLSSEPVIDDYSIAVLPFSDLGSDEASDLISEAITKDVLHNLSLLEDLYVISSYSSMQYKNSDKDNLTIAEELGVAFLLTGTSHRFGDNIRVSAQLIDVVSDKIVWKKSFNDGFDKIMQIESEISKEVIDALRLKLSFDDMQNIVGIPTNNIDAYNAFVIARNEFDKRTAEANKTSIDAYANAIRLDSTYAEAFANVAWATLLKTKYNDIEASNILKLTELYLERAESLDDQIAKIYMVRGALYNITNDPVKAFSSLNRALELAPNDASIRLELAKYFRSVNRPEDQLQQNRLAYQLDPLNPETALEYVDALLNNDDYNSAEQLLNKVAQFSSNNESTAIQEKRIKLYLITKNYKEAISPLTQRSKEDDQYLGSLGYSYIKTADTSMANVILDSLMAMPESDRVNYDISKLYAAFGKKDSMYAYLSLIQDKSLINKDSLYDFFETFKNDSRFKAALRKEN